MFQVKVKLSLNTNRKNSSNMDVGDITGAKSQ